MAKSSHICRKEQLRINKNAITVVYDVYKSLHIKKTQIQQHGINVQLPLIALIFSLFFFLSTNWMGNCFGHCEIFDRRKWSKKYTEL